ncbi:MAG: hypothetical protein ABMA13_16470 [Chthoniobacteraceae bacterium]
MKHPRGSTLFITLLTLSALAMLAAFTLAKIAPRFRIAHQNAAWQEARIAAEGGIDAAMADILRNATGQPAGTWTGWKDRTGAAATGAVLDTTVRAVASVLTSLGVTVETSNPIVLDNVRLPATSSITTEVDVQLWGVRPTGDPRSRWFRIRSMATCALPPAAYQAPEALDSLFRRFSLRSVRPQLQQDDVGTPCAVPLPNISRIVEALVEPIEPFELAVWTDRTLSLGSTGSWGVDSYDSSDVAKSNADGTYPGWLNVKTQENGSIGNNAGRPAGGIYGELIAANGARVRGDVATNGGDDPGTPAQENVTGAIALDTARVRSDFCREMKPLVRPTPGLVLPPPLLGLPFLPGPELAPTHYLVAGNLGAFSVDPAPLGTEGVVVIMINGDLNVVAGTIAIPDNVTAQIYVRGNIHFHGNSINAGAGSCKRPARLQIYGEDSSPALQTLRTDAPSTIYAAFYGPTFEAQLDGNTHWCGAIAARAFSTAGGGGGGVHFDEALRGIGPPVSFRIVRYVEDVRE